eukprot:TRINITY_DN7025_c0_g1_i3.p1 TRINITY_DN7025_c0_g1~~TRINITY_DN7025_c0_g1_i3.p1  ORF type:complete len:319 (-),score=46.21 TRINITY_DN7025_c0_g1_i3:80-952(-)
MSETKVNNSHRKWLVASAIGAAVLAGSYFAYRFFRGSKGAEEDEKYPDLVALQFGKTHSFELVSKTEVNHNVRIFRFALPSSGHRLGLPTGKHIIAVANIQGQTVSRPYTPITTDSNLGYFDLLVKVYDQGKMSQHMNSMKLGDKLQFKGPAGQFSYRPNMVTHIGMVCGGTGLTPMYQVAQAVLENNQDHTQMSLLFANVTEQDIFMKSELTHLATRHPNRFRVTYTLDRPPVGWTHESGRISAEHLSKTMPPPVDGTLILLCGPPPMIKSALSLLAGLGYKEHQIFCF